MGWDIIIVKRISPILYNQIECPNLNCPQILRNTIPKFSANSKRWTTNNLTNQILLMTLVTNLLTKTKMIISKMNLTPKTKRVQ